MRKIALAVILILVLALSGCTAWVIKDRTSEGTIDVNVVPDSDTYTIRIERAGVLLTEATGTHLEFKNAERNRNYLITAINSDGDEISETRSISKSGGKVTVTLNFNE